MAQPVPGAADPARIAPVLDTSVKRFEQLRRGKAITMPRAKIVPAPSDLKQITFVLKSLNVEGMTAYEPVEVAPLYADKLGSEVSLEILYGIAEKLQQNYFDDGYTLTKIIVPEDAVKEGIVRLVAIEGHVTQVELDPELRKSDAVNDAVSRIKAMRPLNTLVLERVLMVLNDLPDTSVSAILATLKDPAPEEVGPGSVRLILKKNPFTAPRGRIAIDDYGSNFTGPQQGSASMHVYHLGMVNSDLTLATAATAPVSEQHYGTIGYAMPLFGVSGTKLNVSAVWARTAPGDTLSPLEIEGETQNFTATISYPLIKQRSGSLVVDAGIAVKQSATDLLGAELYEDRLRTLRIGANYTISDTWGGFNAIDLHATKGFELFGASEVGSALSRADGKPDFEKVEFFYGRVQELPLGFELFGLVSGQYAFDALLSGEEFGFGGGQNGRGYDPSEITGDHGLSGIFELRYSTGLREFDQEIKAQPYAFYDIGKVWNIDTGARDRISATSAGAGLRINVNNQWNSNVSAAFPLTKPVDNPPDYANATGARFLWSISRDF